MSFNACLQLPSIFTDGDDFGLMGDESDEDNGDIEADDDDDNNSQTSDEMNEDNVENSAIIPKVGHNDNRTETTEIKMKEIDKGKEKWEVLADRIKRLAEKKNMLKKSVSFAPAIEEVQMENSDNDDDDSNDEDEEGGENDEEDEEGGDNDEADDQDNDLDVNDDNDFSIGDDDDDCGPLDEYTDSDTELRSHSETHPTKKRKTNETEIESESLKEDIYGRLRDSRGNIILDNKPAGGQGAYVPPAKRMQMTGGSDEKKTFMLQRLQKQLKGLINR